MTVEQREHLTKCGTGQNQRSSRLEPDLPLAVVPSQDHGVGREHGVREVGSHPVSLVRQPAPGPGLSRLSTADVQQGRSIGPSLRCC